MWINVEKSVLETLAVLMIIGTVISLTKNMGLETHTIIISKHMYMDDFSSKVAWICFCKNAFYIYHIFQKFLLM